jgi:hypothetical protein
MQIARLRSAAFLLGVFSLIGSLAALLIGSARSRHIVGYLAQADAGVPFVRWGTLLVLIAIFLGLFGYGKARVAFVISSGALLVYWLLIAESLY